MVLRFKRTHFIGLFKSDQSAIQAKEVRAQIPRHPAQAQTGLFSSNGYPLAVGIKRKLRLWGWAVGGGA